MGLEGRLLGGKYRILRPLGSGGMGKVYVAEQEGLRKQVAVKVLLHQQRTTPADLARFEHEALAAAKLGHPNIVQVTDFQAWPGEPPLLVMELLQGESLHALLARERRLPPDRTIFIVKQVLAALAAAHAAGIIHRDIKPANIFLTRTPAMSDLAKVLDFGIAKTSELPAGFVTAPGAILGTLAYMAPEQAHAGAGDHRIDLYAVGVLLFEMLVGHRPYEAKTLAELLDLLAAERPPVRELAPELDPKLADVIDRALRRDPRHRPQRAVDMLDMLTTGGEGDGATVAAVQPMGAPASQDFTLGSHRQRSEPGDVMTDAPLPGGVAPTVPDHRMPEPAVGVGPATLVSPQERERSPSTDAELRRVARFSLLWSVAGLLFLCFPIGIVGVVTGLRARSVAMRVSLPMPVTALVGVTLGVIGSMASLGLLGFLLWIRFDLRRDEAAAAARAVAIETRVGSTASARDLDGGTACGLAEAFVLRNGVEGSSGWQIRSVECPASLAGGAEQAALHDVQVTATSGRRVSMNVCFERKQRWVVREVRKEPCPSPIIVTPDAAAPSARGVGL